MLIHVPSQKVVLNLKNPARVTTLIPTAREFELDGKRLLAVPHKLEETRVLQNLGFNVPSPVKHHYKWPGRFQPFEAQLETTAFLTMNSRAFVLNDMGTGKTMAALWTFDYLKSIGEADKLLVLSPLSTLERTWGDEIYNNFPNLTANVLHGTKERRLSLLADDADAYLINHHGVTILEKELIAKDIDTIVVDEGAVFRNSSTTMWKALHRLCKKAKRVWWMTGTPTPNAPTDAWAQCRIISPGKVPQYYTAFRDAVMRQQGPFKYVARESAIETVKEAMQPAVRFTREQCVDLPPTLPMPRHAPLTPEQNSAYKEMLKNLKTEIAAGQVTAVNEAVKLSKLMQIACGVVYDAHQNEIVLPCAPRIDAVQEIIDGAAGKVIVFAPFKSVVAHIADELEQRYKVEVVAKKLHGVDFISQITGETPKAQRDRIFHDFQHGEAGVLVASPAAMSHGLTLTAANVVCWYAPITSNEIFQQANARVTRPGQKHTTYIATIEGSPVERKMYDRLNGKQQMQGLLLDLVQS